MCYILWISCHRVFHWSSAILGSCLHGYFAGSTLFLVVILWIQNFFSKVFSEFKFFSRGYFVGLIFFLVANFVIHIFSVVYCMRKSDRKKKYTNTSQTAYSIPNQFKHRDIISPWFQQLSVLLILERCFIY